MPLLRGNSPSGKPLAVNSQPGSIPRKTQDTWVDILLCEACEALLNENYDSYGIGVLKGEQCVLHKSAQGLELQNVDSRRLRRFFLSVLWRASISKHEVYSQVVLPFSIENNLRESFLFNLPIPSSRLSVVLRRLKDTHNLFPKSNIGLRELVMPPVRRNFDTFHTYIYLLLGFVVVVYLPRIPKQFGVNQISILGTQKVVSVPFCEALEFEPLLHVFGPQIAQSTGPA